MIWRWDKAAEFGHNPAAERRQRSEPGAQAPGKVENSPEPRSGDTVPMRTLQSCVRTKEALNKGPRWKGWPLGHP